jgi:PBP1b-binding outer membrane lipoprotein LpoB
VRNRLLSLVSIILVALVVSGCVTTKEPEVVLSTKGAVELRAIQSRKFETPDDKKVYRAIIAVMLDLGYAVTSLEPDARTITGNKLAQLTLTATIPASDAETTTVRANAIVKVSPQKQVAPVQVDGAEFYQTRFFDPLAQALFLEALYEIEPKKPVK